MPERKILAKITAITDHDTGMYHMGEIDGAFNSAELKEHIKSYGHEELIHKLAYMQFQVITAQREVNSEKSEQGVCTANPR